MGCRLTGDRCARPGCIKPPYEQGICYAHWSLLGEVDRRTLRWENAAPSPAVALPDSKPPRCVAYLSLARDVITLELTGEPRFTAADVELVAAALSRKRRPPAPDRAGEEADRLLDQVEGDAAV